jgi:hypothetical protein
MVIAVTLDVSVGARQGGGLRDSPDAAGST